MKEEEGREGKEEKGEGKRVKKREKEKENDKSQPARSDNAYEKLDHDTSFSRLYFISFAQFFSVDLLDHLRTGGIALQAKTTHKVLPQLTLTPVNANPCTTFFNDV